jgi:uncharacterized membrane protein YfhO
VLNLSDKIEDESFYRVKTSAKIFDYNMIGAMGYNSIGHYTSLTDEDYMFTMKRMGYTSVWMEVGTCGGTELTDALLSVGYEIGHADADSSLYTYKGYSIEKTDFKLPMGVISADSLTEEDIPDGLTRAQVQQYIFERIFGSDEKLISEYEPSEGSYTETESGFEMEEGEKLIYRIKIEGNQTLYFDCFDKLTNDLSEPIYDSFSVKVNGSTVSSSYPVSKENGVLNLGEYSDETVIVEADVLKDVSCASFGVFGLDTDVLENAVDSVQTIGLTEKKNGLEGSVTTDGAQTVFLSVPYADGFEIRVNGEKVDYREALSGFIAFDLPDGESDIDISFKPSGFTAGLILSISGLAGTAVYAVLRRRKAVRECRAVPLVEKICAWAVLAAGAFAVLAVYVAPTVINILFWKE